MLEKEVEKQTCPHCKGTGKIAPPMATGTFRCATCHGLGYIMKGLGNDPSEYDLLK